MQQTPAFERDYPFPGQDDFSMGLANAFESSFKELCEQMKAWIYTFTLDTKAPYPWPDPYPVLEQVLLPWDRKAYDLYFAETDNSSS